jgi:hypothetical protein
VESVFCLYEAKSGPDAATVMASDAVGHVRTLSHPAAVARVPWSVRRQEAPGDWRNGSGVPAGFSFDDWADVRFEQLADRGAGGGPGGLSEQRWDHFACESLQLSLIVGERVEQDQFGAGVRNGTEPSDALLRGAREHML